jgi:hypothetical protein
MNGAGSPAAMCGSRLPPSGDARPEMVPSAVAESPVPIEVSL